MKRKFLLWLLYRGVLKQLKISNNHIKTIILKDDTIVYLNSKLHKHGYRVTVKAEITEAPGYVFGEVSSYQH